MKLELNRTYKMSWDKLLDELPDESVDLVLTDPAYDSLNRWAGVGTTARMGMGRAGSGSDDKETKFYPTITNDDLSTLVQEIWRVLKPNRHAYIMCDFFTLRLLWYYAIEEGVFGKYKSSGVELPCGKPIIWDAGDDMYNSILDVAAKWIERFKQNVLSDYDEGGEPSNHFLMPLEELAEELFGEIANIWGLGMPTCSPIIWDKVAAGMGYTYRSTHEYILMLWKGKKRKLNDLGIKDVLSFKRVPPSQAIVPTQKPDELFELLVGQSTQPGELVVDPFMGSGTTARAAAANKCNWLGCDIEQTHVEAANTLPSNNPVCADLQPLQPTQGSLF